MADQRPKILFADQLRGIAALLVVFSHLAGIYWYQPELVAQFVGGPVPAGPVPGLAALHERLPFNPGPFGVAVFFLISGFVIPFSFNGTGRLAFLRARLWRIFPTYLAALLLGLAVRAASGAFWGEPLQVNPLALLANAVLLHDLAGISSVDLVNWTLTVELKFYLLFALALPWLLRWKGGFVVGLAVAMLALNLLAAWAMPLLPLRLGYALRGTAHGFMFLPFLLLGTLFFLFLRGALGFSALLGASAVTLGLFLLTWMGGPMAGSFNSAGFSYLWGWGVFALCFALRNRAVPLAPLRWLSAVSYPLYLVHAMLGYALLQALVQGWGMAYAPALGLALLACLAAAWVLHRLVEKPSMARGKARRAVAPAVA
ncbi:acyltransferase family protein [Roseomonas haemaphysalidis]|uniref:Acyltransferase n=1 Tax=Roseomonas haemaphysalidis TaxID=2768162 RepID=A0ABS3KPI8_9PROT|nr:acyltransferase family protein [Roseomonas haemaphysalidis]MBO1079374.1 acyltransferase [Roseomonas haemaphysalidis]